MRSRRPLNGTESFTRRLAPRHQPHLGLALVREPGRVRQAAARGVSDRLRPLVTTSVTTIIGLIPLALSDPTWKPLCSAIIFGLLAATVIALLVVPALYLLLTPKTENVN